MAICKHPPLSQSNLMSKDKREWWAESWRDGIRQPRAAVFHTAMNTTPRPTNPSETIAYGYMKLNKFHDRESWEVLKAILALDPNFFDTYPRKPDTELTEVFMKALIGEAAQAFYRHGMPAYGKPELRRHAPLAAI